MVKRKNAPVLLEPEATLVVAPVVRHPDDIAMKIESGTIGVDYTPPPKAEKEEEHHNCGNCQGVVLLGVEKCPTCEGILDWSGLNV